MFFYFCRLSLSSDEQIGAGASAKVFKGVERATQLPIAIKSMFLLYDWLKMRISLSLVHSRLEPFPEILTRFLFF